MAKNCNECGKLLTFKDSFMYEGKPICKTCLQKVESSKQGEKINNQISCSDCGVLNDHNNKFCGNCGNELKPLFVETKITEPQSEQVSSAKKGGVLKILKWFLFILLGTFLGSLINSGVGPHATYLTILGVLLLIFWLYSWSGVIKKGRKTFGRSGICRLLQKLELSL